MEAVTGYSGRGWYSRTVGAPADLMALRRAVAGQPGGVMLESTAADGAWGGWSIFAARPMRVVKVMKGDDPFEAMRVHWGALGAAERVEEVPFVGGWIGYFGYEAGAAIEPRAFSGVNKTGRVGSFSEVPIAVWGLYESALVCNHESGEWRIVVSELPVGRSGEDWVDYWREILATAEGGALEDVDSVAGGAVDLVWNDSREEYFEKVKRVLEYIRAGDVFQVNVARRLRARWSASAAELYCQLCAANPATFAAYISIDESRSNSNEASAIVSASPELFLQLKGCDVVTRPIKGTRPRRGDATRDEHSRRELAASTKDRAELNMIIDLERNDLGRVCEYGSVSVESDGEIETLPTVFHRTATVRGRLRQECGLIDLLRATFPGGSITGAPKVRAMQIIDELEDFERGAYCGAIGYVGLNGDAMLNLAIRTMTVSDGMVELSVGSGIVADSNPQEEYAELEAKAAGMMTALKRGGGEELKPKQHFEVGV